MFTSSSHVITNKSHWWRAAVLILLFSVPVFGQPEDLPFIFTRVVDMNTPIPGGLGNFTSFTDACTNRLAGLNRGRCRRVFRLGIGARGHLCR